MWLSIWIGRRLRLSEAGRGPSRSGVVIAISGVALAVAVMLLSIAVVVGFKQAITDKVEGFLPDVRVSPEQVFRSEAFSGYEPLDVRESQLQYVKNLIDTHLPSRAEVSLVMHRPGIIKTDADFLAVEFTAFSAEHDTVFDSSLIIEGSLPNSDNSVAISEQQAQKLGIKLGDKIYTYFISEGAVRTRRAVVMGIFRSNFGEYDQTFAYMSAQMGQKLNGVGSDGFEIRGVTDPNPLAYELQKELIEAFHSEKIPDGWNVSTIATEGASYFNWLELLDTNVVVILILMGFVSGFTLIGSIIILILERVRMIGVLKSLGATNGLLRSVFLLLGSRIVLIGIFIGNVVALGLIFAEKIWHFLPLDPSAYYLDYVPVAIKAWQILVLNLGVVTVALAVMLFPAMIIARISPANVMRYQ